MASSPLVIWRLTDGKPGHMQQTLGLARALAALTPCTTVDIDVSAGGAGLLDLALGRFRPGQGQPQPDLILGAGHGTHLALLAARRATGGKAVALMKPSLPLSLFDFIVVPEHDGVTPGPHTISTLGVLNPMQPGEKEADSLLFLIGGPSKHVQWEDAVILQQLQAIEATLPASCRWRVADSRRTPEALSAELQRRYRERFQPWVACPPGWLAQQLAVTGSVWVSEDSVSMVYEALTAACRVGLLEVPRREKPSRVMRGVEQLSGRGLVTPFSEWAISKALHAPVHFNEAERVARWLLERL
jgi:mitochondrial fission protein ELM1